MDNKYYENSDKWLVKYLQELKVFNEKSARKGYKNAEKKWNEKFEMTPLRFLTFHCEHFPVYIANFYEKVKKYLIKEEKTEYIFKAIKFLKRELYSFLLDLIDLENIHIKKDAEYINKFTIKI